MAVSDPSVTSRFHFSREMIAGPIYRKYEKAMRKVWSVEDIDFTQDALDWERITPRAAHRSARRHGSVPGRGAGGDG